MITFVSQPEGEDLSAGPHVPFRVAEALDGPWTAVALPLAELPTFYWAAMNGGWSIDIGSLIGELKGLQLDILEALGPESEAHTLRVASWYGSTVLEALEAGER